MIAVLLHDIGVYRFSLFSIYFSLEMWFYSTAKPI